MKEERSAYFLALKLRNVGIFESPLWLTLVPKLGLLIELLATPLSG